MELARGVGPGKVWMGRVGVGLLFVRKLRAYFLRRGVGCCMARELGLLFLAH